MFRVRGVVRTGIKDLDGSLIMIGRERAAAMAGMAGQVHELAILLHQESGENSPFWPNCCASAPSPDWGWPGDSADWGLKLSWPGFPDATRTSLAATCSVQGALEAWYRFELGLVLLAEYLHNGSRTRQPGKYPDAVASATFQEGLTYLAGDYLLLAPSAEIHRWLPWEVWLFNNRHDHSLLLRPQCTLSLGNNLNLQLFWSESFGKAPRRDSGAGRVRSEFGNISASGGLLI